MDTVLSIFGGWGTYFAGAGLLGLALYQLSQGDYQHAAESAGQGFAAIFLRRGIARASVANAEAQTVIAKAVNVPAATIAAKITQESSPAAPQIAATSVGKK